MPSQDKPPILASGQAPSKPRSVSCPYCSKTFTRSEHLRRHLTAHGIGDDYPCPVCGKRYKRRDVRNRHLIVCKAKTGITAEVDERRDGTTHQGRSGRRRRKACDRCRQQKRGCDGDQPSCGNCISKKEVCEYAALTDLPENSGPQCHEDMRLADLYGQTLEFGSSAPGPNVESESRKQEEPTASLDCNSVSLATMASNADASLDFDLTSPSYDGVDTVDQLTPEDSSEEDPASSFDFLARFTNRNFTGLDARYDCGTVSERQWAAVKGFKQAKAEHSEGSPSSGARVNGHAVYDIEGSVSDEQDSPRLIWGLELGNDKNFEAMEVDAMPLYPQSSAIFPVFTADWMASLHPSRAVDVFSGTNSGQPLTGKGNVAAESDSVPDRLFGKTKEIVERIREVYASKPVRSRSSTEWSMLLERSCMHFFRPANLEKFLGIYWMAWHPNFTAIHRPTFNAEDTTAILLASMTLVGACLSPDPQDKATAKVWFDAVEEMVFSDDVFQAIPSSLSSISIRPHVQALQASYCVCTYQQGDGTEASKRRVRRLRYNACVALARDLGLANAKHENLHLRSEADFSWEEFIATEERIRTTLFIFLHDVAYAIFLNLPPRMYIREMVMDPACPEAAFQASSKRECYEAIKTWTSHPLWRHKMPFSSAIHHFVRDGIDSDLQKYFAHTGILNLWVISSALLSKTLQLEPAIGLEAQLTPLQNGVDNWKTVWNLRVRGPNSFGLPREDAQAYSEPEDLWRRVGFSKHAPEYWLLVRVLLERNKSAFRSLQASMELSGSKSQLAAQHIFNNCDENTLDELNNMIGDFHRMRMKAEVSSK